MVLYLKKLPRIREKLISVFACALGWLVINILFSLMPDFWAMMFIGKSHIFQTLTFQDVMWFIFFAGLVQIYFRRKDIALIATYQSKDYLPQEFEVIIGEQELTEVIKRVRDDSSDKMGLLPYMILQIALQFRTNNSISITSDFLSKQLELFLHSVELRYNQLKYIIWLIPSLGFMGTVYGIGLAVSQLGEGSLDDPDLLTQMAGSLGIAFNTTLLALV